MSSAHRLTRPRGRLVNAKRPALSVERAWVSPVESCKLTSAWVLGLPLASTTTPRTSPAGGSTSGGGVVGSAAGFLNRQITSFTLNEILNSVVGNAARALGADVLNITSTSGAQEFQAVLNGPKGFLLGTEIEYGRYIGTRSYAVVTLNPARFSGASRISPVGFRLEHRLTRDYRLETTFGPRFLLQSQTLQVQDPNSLQNFGLFLSREWKW